MNNPIKEHMHVVHIILRYLKGIPEEELYFKTSTTRKVEVLTNAD